MNKRGRPRVSDDVAINKQFIIRLSNTERERLNELSERLGIGKAELFRKMLNDLYERSN